MSTASKFNWKEIALLIVLVVIIYVFWSSIFVYPLKMLVVFFHEMSHGLAAIVTGGSIERIELSPQQGGTCYTRGGFRPLVIAAGYLGSLAWGGTILVLAARTRHDKLIMGALGVILLGSAIWWVRPLISFAFGFVFAFGAVMTVAGSLLPEKFNDVLLKVIGLTSCFYAIWDIKSDAIDRNIPSSDASKFGDLLFLNSTIVGVVWIIISLVATVFFLRMAATHAPESDS